MVGVLALFLRTWRFGLVTLLSAVIMFLHNMGYPIHDIHVYYLPMLALLGLWTAVGCGVLVRLASEWHFAPPT